MTYELPFNAPAPTPPPTPTPTPTRDIYTPSRLNHEARSLLERGFATLWLEGEISNLSRPSSGHWYFSLKDEAAQLRSAMFRQRNLLTKFPLKDGMHVLVRGRVSLYEARGDYQFLVDHMEPAGEGALRLRFEALKAKLLAVGLFAPERKKPLPAVPRRIGIVTSPSGAAVRDVLNILRRRWPIVPVLIYPVPVQGAGSAELIAKAIRYASHCRDCDVLIVARGGGSLEDLWAFNEEVVALAIAECLIPVISGVGHEVDFTIADFVADLRAPTPSGAAELAVPDWQSWHRELVAQEKRLASCPGMPRPTPGCATGCRSGIPASNCGRRASAATNWKRVSCARSRIDCIAPRACWLRRLAACATSRRRHGWPPGAPACTTPRPACIPRCDCACSPNAPGYAKPTRVSLRPCKPACVPNAAAWTSATPASSPPSRCGSTS